MLRIQYNDSLVFHSHGAFIRFARATEHIQVYNVVYMYRISISKHIHIYPCEKQEQIQNGSMRSYTTHIYLYTTHVHYERREITSSREQTLAHYKIHIREKNTHHLSYNAMRTKYLAEKSISQNEKKILNINNINLHEFRYRKFYHSLQHRISYFATRERSNFVYATEFAYTRRTIYRRRIYHAYMMHL